MNRLFSGNGLITLLICLSNVVHAENKIILEDLNQKYGFERNHANCMLQDSIGFAWFGMVNGLYKFDNVSIKIIEPTSIKALDNPNVRTITEYKNGVLLLGTYNYGLIAYNTVLEKFDTLTLNAETDLSTLKINSIVVGKYGTIWIGAKNGLYEIQESYNSPKTFKLLQYFSLNNSGIGKNEIIDLKVSEQGDVWFLTMTAIGCVKKSTNTMSTYKTLEANTAFAFLDTDKILISSYGSGLRIFNISEFKLDKNWKFANNKEVWVSHVTKTLIMTSG